MSKLILSMDGLVLKEISLNEERTTIGRRPSNDIVIDNLAISGEHAAIITILNDSFLEDLGSTNGTLVNGQTIKKHFLQNNDLIELGKYKLKFISEAPKPGAATDFEKTMVLRPGQVPKVAPGAPASAPGSGAVTASAPQAVPGGAASPQPVMAAAAGAPATGATGATGVTGVTGATAATAGPAERQAAIQILNGPNSGRELLLTKALTTLGRPGVQVAVITRRPQGYFIAHVEGANSPSVNGTVIGTEARALHDHDVLELSGTRMEFFFK